MTDKTAISKIKDFFALERNIIVLSVSIFILGLGENLWSKFLPKYLQFLGASTLLIGVFGALQEIVETAYQYPGGRIADYIGRKSSLVLCSLIALLGYIIFLLAPSWQFLFLGLFFKKSFDFRLRDPLCRPTDQNFRYFPCHRNNWSQHASIRPIGGSADVCFYIQLSTGSKTFGSGPENAFCRHYLPGLDSLSFNIVFLQNLSLAARSFYCAWFP